MIRRAGPTMDPGGWVRGPIHTPFSSIPKEPAMPEALTNATIAAALKDLPGWSHGDDSLDKTFEFDTFKEAMGFLVRVGFEAEAMNHHPDIHNVYNTVDIKLSTHDADGRVTQKDLDLAGKIESVNWIPQK